MTTTNKKDAGKAASAATTPEPPTPAAQQPEPTTHRATALVPVLYDTTPVAVGEVFAVRHADLAQLLQAGAVELAEPTPDALEPTP